MCVSRLTEQKGFDLLNAVAEEILSCAQIAVLGTGDRAYEDYYRALEARHPGRFSAQIRFSEPLSLPDVRRSGHFSSCPRALSRAD